MKRTNDKEDHFEKFQMKSYRFLKDVKNNIFGQNSSFYLFYKGKRCTKFNIL